MEDPLKIGSKTSTGQIVKEVLGQSKSAAVYTTEDKNLRWSYFGDSGVLPDNKKPAVGNFDALMQTIKTYVPPEHKDEYFKLLGKSLFRALDAGNDQEGADHFDRVTFAIEELAQQNARFSYVSYCLAALAVVLLVGFISVWAFALSGHLALGTWCGLMGATGAAISVAHRIRNLNIDWKSQRKLLAAEGCARVLVGFFFGVLFFMMCTSDLVLGALKDNSLAVLVFATIAGFSERFIPELMEKLEARAGENAQSGS